MSVSKVTLWYRAPGRSGPGGQGANDGQGEVCKQGTQLRLGKVTPREEMPRHHLPFLQGTNLPRNTTAGKPTLPKPLRGEGGPMGISLLLVNSSLLRALRKTQPTARRPGLKQVTKVCYARRRVRRAAPQKIQPPASRIPLVLNQERDVASWDTARNQQQPSNEKHPEIRTSKAFLKPRERPSLLRNPLPGSLPTLGKVVTVTPQKKSLNAGRQGWGRAAGGGDGQLRLAGGSEQGRSRGGEGVPGPSTPHAIPPSAGQQSTGATGDLNSARQPTWKGKHEREQA